MAVELLATKLASQSGEFSPQHVNNWSIDIVGVEEMDILHLSLDSGFNPQVALDEVVIPFGNSEVYYAGKSRFGPGTLGIRDYIDRDCQRIVANWFAQAMPGLLDPTDGRIGVPADYKKEGDVWNFGPDGEGIRLWSLSGVWPSQVQFGGLTMASAEQVMISLQLRYDWAFYTGAI